MTMSFLRVTYWKASDVVVVVGDVVMVMSVVVVVGVVQDGAMLVRMAVLEPLVVAAGQTVVTGLLAGLVARRWQLLVATGQARGGADTQRAILLPTEVHIRAILMV